jgi:hypothetical protein
MKADQWNDVINTNLNSVFNVTRPVIEGMRDRKWGRVIQISSINGLKGQYGQANYAAAKAGMHGFTISLARENAKLGITVNTISPGYIATDMVMAVPEEVRAKIVADIPTGRLGKPEEIAYAWPSWSTTGRLDHRLQPRHQRRPPHGLVRRPSEGDSTWLIRTPHHPRHLGRGHPRASHWERSARAAPAPVRPPIPADRATAAAPAIAGTTTPAGNCGTVTQHHRRRRLRQGRRPHRRPHRCRCRPRGIRPHRRQQGQPEHLRRRRRRRRRRGGQRHPEEPQRGLHRARPHGRRPHHRRSPRTNVSGFREGARVRISKTASAYLQLTARHSARPAATR